MRTFRERYCWSKKIPVAKHIHCMASTEHISALLHIRPLVVKVDIFFLKKCFWGAQDEAPFTIHGMAAYYLIKILFKRWVLASVPALILSYWISCDAGTWLIDHGEKKFVVAGCSLCHLFHGDGESKPVARFLQSRRYLNKHTTTPAMEASPAELGLEGVRHGILGEQSKRAHEW